jgi:hypothetical protein
MVNFLMTIVNMVHNLMRHWVQRNPTNLESPIMMGSGIILIPSLPVTTPATGTTKPSPQTRCSLKIHNFHNWMMIYGAIRIDMRILTQLGSIFQIWSHTISCQPKSSQPLQPTSLPPHRPLPFSSTTTTLINSFRNMFPNIIL